MTQPEIEPTAATQDLLDAESLAYEEAAEAAVTAVLVAQLQAAAMALTAYALELGTATARLSGTAAARLRGRARELYGAIQPDMGPTLHQWAAGGIELGQDQAYEVLGGQSAPAGAWSDADLQAVVAEVDQRARRGLAETLTLVDTLPMDRLEDVASVTTQGQKVANTARQDTRWAVNRAINAGVSSAAEAAGARLLWVSERDACLHCLAHSGHVVDVGAHFPTLTFADRPIGLGRVPYPPLHPNCRCRVTPWFGPAGMAVGGPTALQREARRSVLRGWSAYDSQAARLRAADRLLERGANLPKTVEARARAAVRRGRFE